MKLVICILLLCACAAARADTWLTASVASYHFERKGYCEVNPGVGFEREISTTVRFIGGVYHNSLCRASTYVGASWMPLEITTRLRLGLGAIAVTGYQVDRRTQGSKVLPAVLPTFKYERGRGGFNLVVLPPFDDFKGGLGLQVTFK